MLSLHLPYYAEVADVPGDVSLTRLVRVRNNRHGFLCLNMIRYDSRCPVLKNSRVFHLISENFLPYLIFPPIYKLEDMRRFDASVLVLNVDLSQFHHSTSRRSG